jgi:hypothetical protein
MLTFPNVEKIYTYNRGNWSGGSIKDELGRIESYYQLHFDFDNNVNYELVIRSSIVYFETTFGLHIVAKYVCTTTEMFSAGFPSLSSLGKQYKRILEG